MHCNFPIQEGNVENSSTVALVLSLGLPHPKQCDFRQTRPTKIQLLSLKNRNITHPMILLEGLNEKMSTKIFCEPFCATQK